MPDSLSIFIQDEEFLFRGVIEINWDYENNRPSSAAFKDSYGVSVDRDGGRVETDCINFLKSRKDFFAICKIQTGTVRKLNAVVKYLPTNENLYHAEIHDSEERVQMRGSKPKKIRDQAVIVSKQ